MLRKENRRLERKSVSGIMLTLLLTSMLTLAFNIQPVKASGTIYIRPDGSVEGTDKIQQDGDVYTFTDNIYDGIVVLRSNIIIDGAGYTVQGIGALSTGMHVESGSNVTIKNAKIKGFESGISFFGYTPALKFNKVVGNYIVNNSYGILGVGFSYNIAGNNIINNTWGVKLSASSNNTIVGNNIIANNKGITLWDGSSNNSIFGNNMESNSYGIMLVYGSSNNKIFHNNFINNAYQAYDSFNNIWDDSYPSGGNYWSDYIGVDLYSGPNQDYPSGSDGIGDSAYLIDANNRDRYPLMNPWVERTVGVKVGDWAKYKYEFTWSSTDPNEQPPQDLVDLIIHLEWYGITVLKVFETTITFQTMMHFMNGTETKSLWVVDIDNGSGNGTYLQAFIATNLSKGHRLCTPGPGQFVWCGWRIEETILRPYVGVVRETNHLNVTNWSFIGRYLPLEFSSIDDFYWDHATGIISEHAHQQNFEREGYVTSLSLMMKIVDTNLWKAPIPTTISELKEKIEELGSEGKIDNQGIVKSLIAKLNAAQKLVDKGKVDEAKTILEDDFILQVQNLSGIHITPEAADILIQSTEHILSHL